MSGGFFLITFLLLWFGAVVSVRCDRVATRVVESIWLCRQGIPSDLTSSTAWTEETGSRTKREALTTRVYPLVGPDLEVSWLSGVWTGCLGLTSSGLARPPAGFALYIRGDSNTIEVMDASTERLRPSAVPTVVGTPGECVAHVSPGGRRRRR